MVKHTLTLLQETLLTAYRRYHRVAAFAVVGVLVLGLFGYGWSVRHAAEQQSSDPTAIGVHEQTATTTGPLMAAALPLHISMPTVQIAADFEAPLGLQDSGEIEVPVAYDTVAYYQYGPTPGELGPAVVLGHVDSYQGPAVFYTLGQLEVGDPIEITREDGSTATFAVERLERYPQSDFPTREVYGDLDYAGLRLITCTGVYDHGALRYSHNLIVYARLASTTPATE